MEIDFQKKKSNENLDLCFNKQDVSDVYPLADF